MMTIEQLLLQQLLLHNELPTSLPCTNYLACKYCHTPVVRLQQQQQQHQEQQQQRRPPHPNDPTNTTTIRQPPTTNHTKHIPSLTEPNVTPSSLPTQEQQPTNVHTIVSLPSGYFNELHDYLVCYSDGPTTVDFNYSGGSSDNNLENTTNNHMIPPVGIMYENNIVYAVHIDNVYPNSIGILSIPDYGDTDDIDDIDDIDDDNETDVETNATKTIRTTGTRTNTTQLSWLLNSETWRCDTAASNNTTTRWDNASEPELLEPLLPPIITATCSVCAAVLGFVVVDQPPPSSSSSSSSSSSFFYADGTVSPPPPSVLAYQLLKHQIVVLLPKQRQQEPINSPSPTEITMSAKDHPDSSNNRDRSDDYTDTQDPTLAPETSLPTNILVTPPIATYSYANILSLSQFIIHEMIRYAETKAIFTWVLICQEINMIVESNQMVTKKTTTMLRLRLLHWNTIAASSDDCHKRTIMSLWKSSTTDLPATTTNDPPVGDTDDDQEDDDVEFVVVHVPQWQKRVKVWYETIVTTTTTQTIATTTDKEPTGNMNHPSDTHGKQYPWNTRKSSSTAAIHRSKRNSRMEDWCCRIPSSSPSSLPRTRTTTATTRGTYPGEDAPVSTATTTNVTTTTTTTSGVIPSVVRLYLSRTEYDQFYQELQHSIRQNNHSICSPTRTTIASSSSFMPNQESTQTNTNHPTTTTTSTSTTNHTTIQDPPATWDDTNHDTTTTTTTTTTPMDIVSISIF
jgi:hypothetical protein